MISLDPTAGLAFDEQAHRYTYDGEPMTSVTQVIGRYKKAFDSEAHSLRLSDDCPVKAAELRKTWDLKRDAACDAGDIVHAEAERVAWEIQRTGKFWFCSDPDQWGVVHGKVLAVWQWYTHHIEISGGCLYPEMKVVWPEHRIAGTVDLVAGNYNGQPAIIDWKQNESIDLMGKYNNMLPPFQRGKLALPDLNYWAYALQLNLYRRILAERYDYEAEKMVLVHLKPSGEYQEYEIPFLDKHVDKILEGLSLSLGEK